MSSPVNAVLDTRGNGWTGPLTKAVAVAGTLGSRDYLREWWWPRSPLFAFLAGLGIVPLNEEMPFEWSTDLNGELSKSDWHAGGAALLYYLVPPVDPSRAPKAEDVHIISHSHGRQVVLFAAALGLKIGTWVDVCGPVRDDMVETQRVARANIGKHLHVHGNIDDYWQILGQFGDVNMLRREDPLADVNVAIDGGHTCLLNDQAQFPSWSSLGLADFLRGAS